MVTRRYLLCAPDPSDRSFSFLPQLDGGCVMIVALSSDQGELSNAFLVRRALLSADDTATLRRCTSSTSSAPNAVELARMDTLLDRLQDMADGGVCCINANSALELSAVDRRLFGVVHAVYVFDADY